MKQALAVKFQSELHNQGIDVEDESMQMLLTEDTIMRQHAECKMDNKLRLKQVKNLEDLVRFNIKTVADRLQEEGLTDTSQQRLYSLKKVCDPLLSQTSLPQLSQKAHRSQMRPTKVTAKVKSALEGYQTRSEVKLEGRESQSVEQLPPIEKVDINLKARAGFAVQARQERGMFFDNHQNDPISKLNKFFNTKKRSPRKAPKHNNYIVQRIENQKRWLQELRQRKAGDIIPVEDLQDREQKEARNERQDRTFMQQQSQIDKALEAVMKMKRHIEAVKRDHNLFKPQTAEVQRDFETTPSGEITTSAFDSQHLVDDQMKIQSIQSQNEPDSDVQMGDASELTLGGDRSQPETDHGGSGIDLHKVRERMLGAFDDEKANQTQAIAMYNQRINEIMRTNSTLIEPAPSIGDLSHLTSGKNPVSKLSKIQATKNGDYVQYSEEHVRLVSLCQQQNVSQQRVALIKKRREEYIRQKGLNALNQRPSKFVPPIQNKQFQEDMDLSINAKQMKKHERMTTPPRERREKISTQSRETRKSELTHRSSVPDQQMSVQELDMKDTSRAIPQEQTPYASTLHHSTLLSVEQDGKKRVVKLSPFTQLKSASVPQPDKHLGLSHQITLPLTDGTTVEEPMVVMRATESVQIFDKNKIDEKVSKEANTCDQLAQPYESERDDPIDIQMEMEPETLSEGTQPYQRTIKESELKQPIAVMSDRHDSLQSREYLKEENQTFESYKHSSRVTDEMLGIKLPTIHDQTSSEANSVIAHPIGFSQIDRLDHGDKLNLIIENRLSTGRTPQRSKQVAHRTTINLKKNGYESETPMNNTGLLFAQDILSSAVAFQKPGWQAMRYRRFPRFSIYLNKGDAKEFMEKNYISLSNQVIQFLAQNEPNLDLQKVNTQTLKTIPATMYASSELDPPLSPLDNQQLISGTEEISVKLERKLDTVNRGVMDNATQDSVEGRNRVQVILSKEIIGDQTKIRTVNPALKMTQADPFDKVLLLKNIDNAILTSYRTLSKQNNQISQTLKVLHQKFQPFTMCKRIAKMYRQAQARLYSVSEVEDEIEDTIGGLPTIHFGESDQQLIDDIDKLKAVSQMTIGSGLNTLDNHRRSSDASMNNSSEIIRQPRNFTPKQFNIPEPIVTDSRQFTAQSGESQYHTQTKVNSRDNLHLPIHVEDTKQVDQHAMTGESSKFIGSPKDSMQNFPGFKIQASVFRASEEPSQSKGGQLKQEPTVRLDVNIVNMNEVRIQAAKMSNDNFRPSRSINKRVKAERDSSNEGQKTHSSFSQLMAKEQAGLEVPSSLHPRQVVGKAQFINVSAQRNINVFMPKSSEGVTETTQLLESQRLSKPNITPERETQRDTVKKEESFDRRRRYEERSVHIIKVERSPKLLRQQPEMVVPSGLVNTLAGKNTTENSGKEFVMNTRSSDVSIRGIEKSGVTLTTHSVTSAKGRAKEVRDAYLPIIPLGHKKVTLQINGFDASNTQTNSQKNSRQNEQSFGTEGVTQIGEVSIQNQSKVNFGDGHVLDMYPGVRNQDQVNQSLYQANVNSNQEGFKSGDIELSKPQKRNSKDMKSTTYSVQQVILNNSSHQMQKTFHTPSVRQTLDDQQTSSVDSEVEQTERGHASPNNMILNEGPENPLNFDIQVLGTQVKFHDSDQPETLPTSTIQARELLMELVARQDNSPSRMKLLIDSLYLKEKRYIYQKQGNTRADFVGNQSVIFNLSKLQLTQTLAHAEIRMAQAVTDELGMVQGYKLEIGPMPKKKQ